MEDYLAMEAMRLEYRLRVTWDWEPGLDELHTLPLLLRKERRLRARLAAQDAKSVGSETAAKWTDSARAPQVNPDLQVY